jgi:hypothetical protein
LQLLQTKKKRVEKDEREKKSRRARESRQQQTGPAPAATTTTTKRKGVLLVCMRGVKGMNGRMEDENNGNNDRILSFGLLAL